MGMAPHISTALYTCTYAINCRMGRDYGEFCVVHVCTTDMRMTSCMMSEDVSLAPRFADEVMSPPLAGKVCMFIVNTSIACKDAVREGNARVMRRTLVGYLC